MKTKSLISVIACVLLAVVTFILAQDLRDKLEGWKPYTPSRLEWIAMRMNAENRVPLSLESGFGMSFTPIEREDAIIIDVIYLPNVNREVMNINIASVRKIIPKVAKGYGWDSWLIVKEQIELGKLKN